MQSEGGQQASPHVSSLEDRQIVQITIDNETNGREFEFSSEILAKEIRIKGFMFYSSNVNNDAIQTARGCVQLDIEWLKVFGVQNNYQQAPEQNTSIRFPWVNNSLGLFTYDYSMDLPISLPSQTSMRKRFKATLNYSNPLILGVRKLPYDNELFRFVILLEVIHDHIFR